METHHCSTPPRPMSTLFLILLVLSLFHTAQCTPTLDRRKAAVHTPDMSFDAKALEKRHGYSLPRAFDTSLGSNFTAPSCPAFFNRFTSDPNVANCIPVSLMLQNSNSFFDATKSTSGINKVLKAACSVTLPTCSAIMTSYADQILLSSACLVDYNEKNPVVVQAYAGLVAYQSLYQSTCTKSKDRNDADSYNNYCFTNAITNSTSPTNSYVYYLPLGVSLPSESMPTCDWCLQHTMAQFANYASNASLPISLTYASAASSINKMCGRDYVQAHVKTISGTSPTNALSNGTSWIAALATLFAIFLSL